jgi:hypothetical protein
LKDWLSKSLEALSLLAVPANSFFNRKGIIRIVEGWTFMGDNYKFIRMSEDRLGDFRLLAEDAFGIRPSAEENRQLFDTSAWGKDYIGYLAYAEDSDEAAAFYGIFPCYVEYDGTKYLAAQSGSTMTHSKHRKKGLFYKTGKRTFELARDEGVNFVFGFPNPNSYPGLMKLGWKHDGDMNSYHIFVPTFPIAFLADKLPFVRSVHDRWFRFVARFWRTEYRAFPSSGRGEGVGTVCRDEALLAYKAESDHRFMLRIGKCTVWINRQFGRIGIGDIDLAKDEQDVSRVLLILKLICFLTGSFHLRMYVSPGSRLDKIFQKKGYRPRKGIPICHLDLGSGLPLERFKYVYADFDTF